jgi:3-mercaptopyruvate sulfurtransferase SseA
MRFSLFYFIVFIALSACNPVGGISANAPIEKSASSASDLASRDDLQLGQITGVDIERLFALLEAEQVFLVDCRPPLFYFMGHINGAINLPYKKLTSSKDEILEQLDEGLAERKVIVLYCQNYACPDAYVFAKKIAELGYSSSVYKGGWQEWKSSGL